MSISYTEVDELSNITMKSKDLPPTPETIFRARNLPNTPTLQQVKRYLG
jgi:hypothetical protein